RRKLWQVAKWSPGQAMLTVFVSTCDLFASARIAHSAHASGAQRQACGGDPTKGTTMMKINEPLERGSSKQALGAPVLRLGFRPFYLGGAGFGLIALALWLVALHGRIAPGQGALTGVAWHVHEMLFGF